MTKPALLAIVLLLPTVTWASSPLQTAAELGGRALASDEAYNELEHLCNHYGPRISGSELLEDAIDWAVAEFQEDGLTTVKETVTVPKWVRGPASATVFGPIKKDLQILTLGGSISTPKRGIRAPLTVVESFDELAQLGDAVDGHIVLFDVPFTTYGETVAYRRFGAARAAEQGAVAALIRSVSPSSLYTPHTGNMSLRDGPPPIPAAALTLEDAAWLNRLSKSNVPVELALNIQANMDKDATSHNVIAEIKGRTTPEEIVVIGCHIDAWDVGQGAHDDGAGCVMVMEAARLINELEQPPKRTTRFILYTNEENGLQGGLQYADSHASEVANHVAAIEADTGAGIPYGFGLDLRGSDEAQTASQLTSTLQSLTPLKEALRPYADPAHAILQPGFSGADISPLVRQGVLGFGLRHDMTDYWPIHHTEADTFDKIDPLLLRRNVAQMTIAAYLLAELDWDIPRTRQ